VPSGATPIAPAGIVAGVPSLNEAGASEFVSRALSMFNALATHVAVPLHSPSAQRRPMVFLLTLAVAVVCVFLVVRLRLVERCKSRFVVWFMALSVPVLVYPVYFWGKHFYYRYTAPLSICFIPLIAWLIVEIVRKTEFSLSTVRGALFVFFCLFAVGTYHRVSVGNPHSVTAGFIQNNVESQVIGAFQSGVIGYYDQRVVNLDGKMDYESLISYRGGTIEEYVDESDVDLLVDWDSYLSLLETEYLDRSFASQGELANGSIVFERIHVAPGIEE
jgi:hypothetical protein